MVSIAPGGAAPVQLRENPTAWLGRPRQNRSKRGVCNSNEALRIKSRSTLHQLDPGARDRRGTEVQLGTSRDADGNGADRLSPMDAFHALQPGQPALARARPIRALGRARLDAAICDALSHWLRCGAVANPTV